MGDFGRTRARVCGIELYPYVRISCQIPSVLGVKLFVTASTPEKCVKKSLIELWLDAKCAFGWHYGEWVNAQSH